MKYMLRHSAALLFVMILSLLPLMCVEAASYPGETELTTVLEEFEEYAKKSMADWQVPGMAIAIVRGNDVIYEKAFGVKKLGKSDPVTTDTLFQIGSTSKAFTAALVATLVDEGKVNWDDPVTRHYEDFRMNEAWVTEQFMVTDLMAQRSGMPEHALDSLIMLGYDRQRVIDSLKYVKPATSFRSMFAYQNNLWLVAAEIVEKYTGKSWEENIEVRIFRPLGMSASSCDKRSYVTAPDAATLHHLVDGKIVALPMSWLYMDWVYAYGPAGGINSTIKDVVKWIRMQAAGGAFEGRQLIKEENVRYMEAPKTIIGGSKDPEQYYCLGWLHREADPHPIVWHNGGTSGSKTMIAFVPEAKLGIVVLSNLADTKLPESIAFRLFDLYFGNAERDWSAEALVGQKEADAKEKAKAPKQPALPLHARPEYKYHGDYMNEIYGTINVAKKGDGLILTIGPKKTGFDLRHWDKDTFMASWDYFGVHEDAGLVTFSVSDEGQPNGVTVEMLNEDGCGVFRQTGAKPAAPVSIAQAVQKATVSVFDRIFDAAPEKKGVKEISYVELLRLCASGEKILIVDVLSPDDYNTGHIPGAISFPVKNINRASAAAKMPAGACVVVYCLDEQCTYSEDAARKLSGYGYKVVAYKGGLDEWQQRGRKLERK